MIPSNAIISPPNSFSICNHYYEFITIKEKIFTLRVCFDIIEPQGVISINGRRLSLSIAEGIPSALCSHAAGKEGEDNGICNDCYIVNHHVYHFIHKKITALLPSAVIFS
jgi:hypothetical protein